MFNAIRSDPMYYYGWMVVSIILLTGIIADIWHHQFKRTPLWWMYGIIAFVLAVIAPSSIPR